MDKRGDPMKLSDEDKQLLKVSVFNRIELFGLWERIHNPEAGSKLVEFESTSLKSGRYGGIADEY